ncbi:hypothetical protein VUJ46_18490 [Chryseobacterium sp. MYb264]|uniref:hypothetical protein n=1 Tax=Chryseobacterium sp. MYb264 TaxID=2745153 RepID=UPI002E0EA6C3|nr:hypothetical protein VUJ46_18490 [Chryseobacterium sp. MYb264]
MKKISVVVFSFCLTVAFGQKVSDYKYIAVPEKLESFKRDYGVKDFFIKSLKGKKYEVISAGKGQWPAEINGNTCNVIFADVKDDSSWLVNKVILEFKDCNDKVILESKARTDIKEFEEGFQDAVKKAMVNVSPSNPTVNLAAVENTQRAEPVKEIATQNQTKEPATTTFTTSSATKFTNGKVNLQKIQLADDQFILADPNSSVPYATFKATAKKDVFRVKLANGESTLGYIENGNIVIEIPQASGDFSREVFSGK